jgi:hypothetical protein
MISALILVISTFALGRFGFCYWRTMLLRAAAEPVSDEVCAAAGLLDPNVKGQDFKTLVAVHSLTLEGGSGLGIVGIQYRLLTIIRYVLSGTPAIASWTERELALCARYVAVQIDHRLRANLAWSESLASD